MGAYQRKRTQHRHNEPDEANPCENTGDPSAHTKVTKNLNTAEEPDHQHCDECPEAPQVQSDGTETRICQRCQFVGMRIDDSENRGSDRDTTLRALGTDRKPVQIVTTRDTEKLAGELACDHRIGTVPRKCTLFALLCVLGHDVRPLGSEFPAYTMEPDASRVEWPRGSFIA